MIQKITPAEGLRLRDKLKQEYSALHQQFDLDEQYHELDIRKALGVPDEFYDDASVLPTARQLVDVYTDHVDLANARVTVPVKQVNIDDRKAVEAAEAESEMLAKFGKGLLYRALVEEDISQPRVAAKHQGLYGLGCLKTVYDADRWPKQPKRKAGEAQGDYNERVDQYRRERDSKMPIVIQAVNPATLYPDPSYSGRQFVIEEQEKVLYDVRNEWPRFSNPRGKLIDDRVTVTSYWDAEWRIEWLDDEVVLHQRHKYGFIPYVFIESGLGNISIDGALTKRYVGLLRYLRDLLRSESRNFSLYDVAIKKGALPWYTVRGEGADQIQLAANYGEATVLPPNVELEQRFPDLAPDAVMRQVEIINSMMMAYGAPRATQGIGEPGVRSAAHARTLADLGGVKFQYPSESFRNKVAKVLAQCALIYKHVVPDDIRLWARTPTDEFDDIIDKKKIKPPFTFYVEFAPYSEEKEYVKYEALMKLVKAGIGDVKWARKQIPNMDWKQMEQEDRKRMVSQYPGVQAAISSVADAYVQDAVERLMIAEELKAGPRTLSRAPLPRVVPSGNGGSSNILSQSTPAPLPGSAGDIQNRMDNAMPGMPEAL